MSRSLPLYLIVSLSGGSVLAIEILGTRVLGPFYGVSLFLWSALITVTLAGLSVGYAVGGRWADRGPSYRRLAGVLAVAAVLTLLIPWLKVPVLKLTEPLGLRPAVLVTATILFAFPLTLLGMVSPYAIRLATHRLDEVGTTAGNIYAVSTVASVLAAVATGFLLVPAFGVNRLLLFIGLALLLAAVIALLADRRSAPVTAGSIVLLVLLGSTAAFTLPVPKARPEVGLVAVKQSPYAELRVVDWENLRLLLIDGGGHTVVERGGDWRSHYPYAKAMDLMKNFYEEPGKVVLLGLGGGSVAKSYAADGWDVDVVEIDPGVYEVAREYFGLEPEEADVHVMDGRQFLLRTGESFDLALLDAFGSGAVPFHLVTREAFADVKARLRPGGYLAMNIECRGWTDVFTRSLVRTLGEVFTNVACLPLVEPRTEFGNLILIASDRELAFDEMEKLEMPRDVLDDEYRHWETLVRNHAWDNRFTPDPDGAPLLTDDHNPVDLWAEEINLEARRRLHSRYEWGDLAW